MTSLRKLFIVIWFLLWVVLFILISQPVSQGIIRVSIVGVSVLIWGTTLILIWEYTIWRNVFFLLNAVLLLLLKFDGNSVSPDVIRKEYVKELIKYEGADYLWGGESEKGIDCSGLVRRGKMDADLKMGVTKFSPKLIKKAIQLWFFDCSAEALKDGYMDLTKPVLIASNLNEMDYSRLREGDIMVTANGVHTMVYIGDSTWIAADPGVKKVIRMKAPDQESVWFKMEARIVRWSELE